MIAEKISFDSQTSENYDAIHDDVIIRSALINASKISEKICQ